MKQRITTYAFNAAAKTVDFSAVSGFDVRGVLAIINGSVILYAVGTANLNFASVVGSVVTLNASVSTAGMTNSDPLLIFYDDAVSPATDQSLQSILTKTNAGPAYVASGKTSVIGTFIATGQSSSFTPIYGRSFNVSLWGTFVATARLERSFDSGTTWMPITGAGTTLYSWTVPASEQAQEDEAGVIYRLNCTAYTSGTVNYRVSQ